MRTLGELVDRLSVTNLKLWAVQDEVYKCAKSGKDLPNEVVKKLASLNLERNKAMTEIDNCLATAIRTGHVEVDARVKITG